MEWHFANLCLGSYCGCFSDPRPADWSRIMATDDTQIMTSTIDPAPTTSPTTNPNELRRKPRFALKKGSFVKAFVMVDGNEVEHSASVLDLSQNGAKFGMSESLPIKSHTSVRFVCDSLQLEFCVSGTICWARPMGRKEWWIGCSFADPIDKSYIRDLARAGLLERRQDQREPLDVSAVVQWECQPEPIRVRMLDLSPGGFQIRADEKARLGERIVLSFGDRQRLQAPIVARVQWCEKVNDVDGEDYRIGCAFLNREGFSQCRQRVTVLPPMRKITPSRMRQSWWIVVLGVAAAGLGAFLAWQQIGFENGLFYLEQTLHGFLQYWS